MLHTVLTLATQNDFYPCRATDEAKNKFIKAVFGYVLPAPILNFASLPRLSCSTRSMKRTRDAAQQFTLVARGLEGSTFGYATVSM